jgi:hypothetical protein
MLSLSEVGSHHKAGAVWELPYSYLFSSQLRQIMTIAMKYFSARCAVRILHSESQHFRAMELSAPQVDSSTKVECPRKVEAKRILFSKVFVIVVLLSILFFYADYENEKIIFLLPTV